MRASGLGSSFGWDYMVVRYRKTILVLSAFQCLFSSVRHVSCAAPISQKLFILTIARLEFLTSDDVIILWWTRYFRECNSEVYRISEYTNHKILK